MLQVYNRLPVIRKKRQTKCVWTFEKQTRYEIKALAKTNIPYVFFYFNKNVHMYFSMHNAFQE